LNLRVPIAVSLAVALFLAIGGAISWWWWRELLAPPVVPNMQPILDKNQQEALRTYKRRCRYQEERPRLASASSKGRGKRASVASDFL